jgi:hypothetical protein
MVMQLQHNQHQRHLSLVITLDNELAQKSILKHKFIFSWGHPMQIKEYPLLALHYFAHNVCLISKNLSCPALQIILKKLI